MESKLPDKVMQLLFNSVTGFHFPFAHFPTVGMKSEELKHIVEEAITALSKHNFQVNG